MGSDQVRYSLLIWDTKVEQFLACVEGLFCLKNGTQSINCSDATKEKGRLSLFGAIREFGSTKRDRQTGRGKGRVGTMFFPMESIVFPGH